MNLKEIQNFKEICREIFKQNINPSINNDMLFDCCFCGLKTLTIHFDTGKWRCPECNRAGDAVELISEFFECGDAISYKALMSDEKMLEVYTLTQIEKWHDNLMLQWDKYHYLWTAKGITKETIKNLQVGLKDNGNFIYPIQNGYKAYISVNNFQLIYPKLPEGHKIFITSDIYDCIAMNQVELPAIVGDYQDNWLKIMKGKSIYIVCRNSKRAKEIAYKLHPVAENVFFVCVDIQKSVWSFLKENDITEFLKIERELYSPQKISRENPPILDPSYNCTLKEFQMNLRRYYVRDREQFRKSFSAEDIEQVIQWFKINGAIFRYNPEDGKKFMIFKGETYEIGDEKFNGLLFSAGISFGEPLGRNFYAGFKQAIINYSEQSEASHWIANSVEDPYIIYWNLHNSKILVIKENEVSIIDEETCPIVISCIQSKKEKIFRPFIYNPDVNVPEALGYLWKHCMQYWRLERSWKEILICWLASAILSPLSTIKPGVRLFGDAGAGKSTIMEFMTVLFMGDPSGYVQKLNTMASIVRQMTKTPLVFLDDYNVVELDDRTKSVFNIAATGKGISKADKDSNDGVIRQNVSSLVCQTGLTLIQGVEDFSSRYYEIEINPQAEIQELSKIDEFRELMKYRDDILSAFVKIASQKILPMMKDQERRKKINKHYYQALGSKFRTSEYFAIMMDFHNVFEEERPDIFVCLENDMIHNIILNSKKNNINNSSTLECMKTVQDEFLQLKNYYENELEIENEDVVEMVITEKEPQRNFKLLGNFSFKTKIGKWKGFIGSSTQLISMFRWAFQRQSEKFPFKNMREFWQACQREKNAWSDEGWKIEAVGNQYKILFPQPIDLRKTKTERMDIE